MRTNSYRIRGVLEVYVGDESSVNISEKPLGELSNDEIVAYSKDLGYFGMRPSAAKREDAVFYREIVKRDLVDKVFVRAKRKNNSLRDWNLVKGELLKAIEEFGHFPSLKELQGSGRSSIAMALAKYHGGFYSVRDAMGYGNESKEKNYWKDFLNVELELRAVVEQTGHFPTMEEFGVINRMDLCSGIQKYHGGLDVVRVKLGYSYGEQKPDHYWDDKNVLEKELKHIIDDLKHFPSKSELEQMGRNDLNVAIQRYHGGVSNVRKRMGYSLSFRITGQLRDIGFIKNELIKIINSHSELNGNFPSDDWLRNNGYMYVSGALRRYHGGINKVRREMGHDAPIRPANYLKSWENVERELRRVIEAIGHFPSQQELKDLGQSSIAVSIHQYHGGMITVRNRMSGSSEGNLERVLETYTTGGSR